MASDYRLFARCLAGDCHTRDVDLLDCAAAIRNGADLIRRLLRDNHVVR
jgi:hypothetical protein